MPESKLENIIKELSFLNKRRERELKEMDRTAKMLIRRDLDLNEITEKREMELVELKESKHALMGMLEEVKDSKKKIEEERDKTMAIFANFTDGLLLFNKDNRLEAINYQAEKFLAVKAGDVVNKTISEISNIPVIGFLVKNLGQDLSVVSRRGLEMRKGLFLEISGVPMKKDEEKWAVLIILHDVTREKMVEKTKTEFVSIAAHQLRTPLSAIKWTLKTLLEGEMGALSAEQKNYLEKTYKTNESMIDLVNDLLSVAKIEEGKILYNRILSDMESVIKADLELSKEEIDEKKLEVVFIKPPDKLPDVLIDTDRMKLVVQNLLDNAIKYTPAGGKIKIEMKQNKGELEFSIKDSGMGILPENKDRMFTKFFRSADAIKRETDGSGLGLFIAKNIIEAHEGRIWYESEAGVGSTFYFSIPTEIKKIINQ